MPVFKPSGAFLRTVPSGAFARQFRRLPTISFVGTAAASNSVVDFAAMGARKGDCAVFECARGFATAPSVAAGWAEIWPNFTAATPLYHVGWSKAYLPGDADPLGAVSGQHRGGVWRNARVKAGSASDLSSPDATGAAISIPAKAASGGEIAVASLAQSSTQASLAAALPPGATQRWSRFNVAPAGFCADGPGWAQVDGTLGAAGMFHSAAYVLEPYSGFMFAA